MWLFPWFVKYVIEIHVAKVALGVLHLNFLQLAPGRSTSFKLVDHSPTHNTSRQRARSYILISLKAHWRISEHTHRLISSDDGQTHPAWRNWLVFPDAYTLYYTYILLCLVLACTVLFSFSPSLFFRFSCLIFFSCWAFSGLIFVGKVFRNAFRILELAERKGRWVAVEQDFHGNLQVNITWFFAFFSCVLDWIVLILVWFERSLHFAQVSGHKLSMTFKTDDVTSSRNTWV